MAIRDWPAESRPREKLLRQGPEALTDAELLAIFLRTGVAGVSAVELAQQLLDHFGGLDALLRADLDAFTRAKGLGTAKYVQLKATLEMARRYFEQQLRQGETFSRPEAVAGFLRHLFDGSERELFVVLHLDNAHRLLAHETLFTGTLTETAVYPREVARQALLRNAAAIIVAHNHPSGSVTPSTADRHITRRLNAALALLDIRLLDHFIVAGKRWCSLRQLAPEIFE
ncbi:DNA repair protein RadC [Sulfurivirga sp.]|uniref:RadC family protein n=1 Tax=Sulfurivirga sp. TaxID=2614236 RepID=UPI0025E64420|nr:DNA repair protein RadC [Sulfurivirga sp.]